MPRELRLFEDFDRREVHDIFDPDSSFTPQSGCWGLWGILKIPEREQDYVFFVTFGQQQSGHVFQEGIDTNGILTWQSQPKQRLVDKKIQGFIAHDYLKNNIYLLLRTQDRI